MIVVVESNNREKHPGLLEDMFRLRARVFAEKLKWEVPVVNGMERDRFDDEDPVYIIHSDASGQKAKASLRLLPTTGPTLVSEVFADTLPDAALLSSPSIWECTRFCVDEQLVADPCRDNLLLSSGTLLAALGEVAIKAGVESILGNFDAAMLRLYRRVGLDVHVLGQTIRQGRTVFLGSFPVSDVILKRVKARIESPSVAAAKRPVLAA